MRILEDDDGFPENDSLFIIGFLHDNLLDAFAELVAYSYLPKTTTGQPSRLFTAEVQSRYSGKKHFVYFANSGDNVFIFDDALTKSDFPKYIANYFSASSEHNDSISQVCQIAISNKSFALKQKEIFKNISDFNTMIVEKHDFIHGAITFLDFLAWKGLWQSQDGQKSLNDVSGLIEDFRSELNRLSQSYFSEAKNLQLSSLISISDTIAVFTPKTNSAKVCDLLEIHARFSQYVLEHCCEKKYAIRGAITYGEYSVMQNVMIGPGIDECASWHETGNWIGVHLTPTAQINWDMFATSDDVICKNDHIPLKPGLKAHYCVKWHISREAFNSLAFKNRALLPEIANKYTNTQEFLQKYSWKEDMPYGKE